jgi:hypothetical protein
MSTISSQLRQLRKLIKIRTRIEFVDHDVPSSEFKPGLIYIHIWI